MSDAFDYDLVCIGSGPAGQRGAVQAAKLGRRVALVERRGSLGGICLDMGTIPSKTFREAVVALTEAAARTTGSMERAALPRPTAQELLARIESVVGREAHVIAMEYASMFAALGVAVTIVDKRDRPLEFLDAEIVDELVHQMRKRNVSFRFGEAVDRLEVGDGSPRRAVLMLESGKRIVADMALFSVGR